MPILMLKDIANHSMSQASKASNCEDSTSHPKNSANSRQDENEEHADVEQNHYNLLFRSFWSDVTSDNRLTLFGFQRYRTTHLFNLRFLEAEINEINHKLYQTGLQLDSTFDGQRALNRLGLRQAKRDTDRREVEYVVDRALVLRLRSLIKEYGKCDSDKTPAALIYDSNKVLKAFNTIIRMETFSLAENPHQCLARPDLHAYKKFKTRMLRVNLPLRPTSRDPIQHFLRKGLQQFWYTLNVSKLRTEDEEQERKGTLSSTITAWDRTYQNTAQIAEAISRFIIGMLAGATLVVPLSILASQDSQKNRLLVVVFCVSIFCFLLSLLSKATNYETMAASAAYAAVLTVFISNGSWPQHQSTR